MRTGIIAGGVVLAVIAVAALCARSVSRAASNDVGPLRVTTQLLSPDDYIYEYPSLRKTQPYFELRCTVTNISGETQRFTAFNCSWDWNWHTDNTQISTSGWPCFRNFTETIELAPGERYEKILPLTAPPKYWGKKLSLRVGFSRYPKHYAPGGGRVPVIWSAPLSIKVSRPSATP